MDRVIALYNIETGALKDAQIVNGLDERAIGVAKYLLRLKSEPPWVVVDSDHDLNVVLDGGGDNAFYAGKIEDYSDEQLIAVYCDNLPLENEKLNRMFEAEFDRRGLKL